MSDAGAGRHLGAGALLRLSAGAMVWASAFVALYAGHSLGCLAAPVAADAGLANPVTITLVALALAHGVALTMLLRRWFAGSVPALEGETERTRRFRHRVEGLVLWISLTALVVVAAPVLMVTPCQG